MLTTLPSKHLDTNTSTLALSLNLVFEKLSSWFTSSHHIIVNGKKAKALTLSNPSR